MHPLFEIHPSTLECINCPVPGSLEKMRVLDAHYSEDAAFVRQAGRYALGLAATKAMEAEAILAEPSRAKRDAA